MKNEVHSSALTTACYTANTQLTYVIVHIFIYFPLSRFPGWFAIAAITMVDSCAWKTFRIIQMIERLNVDFVGLAFFFIRLLLHVQFLVKRERERRTTFDRLSA